MKPNTIAFSFFVFAAALSFCGLLGWIISSSALLAPFNGTVPINPLAAIHFLLISISLVGWSLWPRAKNAAAALWVLVAISCAVVVLGKLTPFSFPIDQLLFHDTMEEQHHHAPNKGMSLATAICMLIVVVTLFQLRFKSAFGRLRELLDLVVFFFSVTAFGIYLFRVSDLGPFFFMSPMAAMIFLFLSAGLLLQAPDDGFMKELFDSAFGTSQARIIIVLLLAFPMVLGYTLLQGERQRLLSTEAGVTIMVISYVIVFSMAIWVIARSFNKRVTQAIQIELLNNKLASTNSELQATLEELKTANEELNVNIDSLQAINSVLEKAKSTIARQKDEQLNRVLDSTRDVIWSFDLTGKGDSYLSRSAEKLYGRPHDELLTNPYFWKEYVHPEDRALKEESLTQLEKTGATSSAYRVEINNEIRWFRDELKMIRNEQGVPVRLEGVAMDITELRMQEGQLKDYRQNLEIIFRNSADNFVLLDEEARIVLFNDNFRRFTELASGITPLAGMSVYTVLPRDRVEASKEIFKKTIQGERIEETVTTMTTGTPRYFQIRYSPVVDGDKVKFVTISAFDVTEKKTQEIRLQDKQKELETIFNNSQDIFFSVDRDHRLAFFNKRFYEFAQQISGVVPTVGADYYLFVTPDRVELNRIHLSRAFGGDPYDQINTIHTKTGTVSFLARYIPVVEDGIVTHVVISAVDKTEEEKQKEIAKQQQDNLDIIFKNTTDAFVLVDLSSQIIFFNQAFAKFVNEVTYVEPHIGMRFTEVVAAHRKEAAQQLLEKAAKGERSWTDVKFLTQSGRTVYYYLRYEPIFKNGEVTHICLSAVEITNFKKIEEELRQKQYFLDKASEAAGIGYWISEPDLIKGKITWSKELFALFGIDEKDFTGELSFFYQFVHPDDRDRVTHALQKALQDGAPYDLEHRIVLSDSSIKWVSENASILRDENGKAQMMVGITQDITRRKEAEFQLKQDQYFLEKASESAKIGYWTSEPGSEDGKLTWSKEVFDIFGVQPHDFDGTNKTFFNHIHPDDRSSVADLSYRVFHQHAIYNIDHRIVLPDGSIRWVNERAQVILDDNNNPALMVGVVQDINERKVTESTLREYNERFEIVSRATNDAIWDWDIKEDTLKWNHAIQSLFGYDQFVVPYAREWRLQKIHPDDYRRVVDEVNTAFKHHISNWTSEYRYQCRDGSYKNVLNRAYILYEQQTPVRMIGAMQDITEVVQYRRDMEGIVAERTKELNKALQKERELVEMKGKFVSIASHEFRTPLATISLASGFLKRYRDRLTTEQIESKINSIEEQVKHMTFLLDDVLFAGKSDEGKIKVDWKQVPVTYIESLAQEALSGRYNNYHLEIVRHATPDTFLSDDKLLRNIVYNLVSNAAKFSPPDSTIYLNVTGAGDELKIAIRDTGIGIPPNEIQDLFESFARASNAGSIEGTGLGLLIIKRAVGLLNGTVEVKSELGKGTEFVVSLPVDLTDRNS